MVKDTVKYINDCYAKIWKERPAELGNLYERNKANGKHFSVWVNAYVDISVAKAPIFNATVWAVKKEGDLDTFKTVCADTMTSAAATFKVSFLMKETADLFTKIAAAYKEVTSFEELGELSRATHLYMVRLWYWIDGMAPWAKLSETFNAVKGF